MSTTTYIMIVILFMVVYGIGMMFYMKKKKGDVNAWLEKNPNACKVFITNRSYIVKSEGIYVHSVDGEEPVQFLEGMKQGIYLLPGVHVIESTFTTSRVGVVHKTVTNTYGPSKQEVEAVKGKTYRYSFDEDEKEYLFEEVDG